MIDENGNFVRASIEGIDEKGTPIYGGNLTAVDASVEKKLIMNSRNELKEKLKEFELTPAEQKVWFDDNPDLYEQIIFTDSSDDKMPVTVITNKAHYDSRNTYQTVESVLYALVALDFAVAIFIYLLKAYRREI